ncbi:MAG: cytochrome P450 [Deltaproteobacteria bacterium]|nr:cytochrome P450 [Deltaproteobacteria bacterium]
MIDYDPFSDEALRDPFPIYRRLREESPVHYIERWDAWALSRFDDIWRASTDSEHLTTTRGTSSPFLLTKAMAPYPNLNHMDPPEHTKLRKLIAPFFLPRHVRNMREQIRGFVTQCIDSFIERGEADVVGELAQIVAVRMGCLAIGFPEQDADYLVDLVGRFMSREEGVEGMTEVGVEAFEEMRGYLERISDPGRARTSEPQNPIDAMARAALEGQIPREEIGQHLALLLIGATETFPKTVGNAVLLLAQHPDQRAALVADPAKIPNAWRECLRLGMPTQFLMRSVVKPFEIRGQKLSPNQSVMFMYASANRDEREFRDPDRFDIQRSSPRILTFGHGTHRCLGANFAELEGQLLLEELLRRIPEYEVDLAGSSRHVTEFLQGFDCLPIRFPSAGRERGERRVRGG